MIQRTPAPKAHHLSRDGSAKLTALLLLMPAMIFILGLIAYPLVQVLTGSFQYKHLVNKTVSGFAGLDNFRKVIADEHFFQALTNTAIWTVFSVLGEYLMGLTSAVALNQNVRGRGVFRMLIVIPWLVPIIVAGMTWDWMLNPDFGIINFLLVKVGILEKPIYFLGEKATAMPTVIFVNIWRSFPYYTISFLAALQAIPHDLKEASAIDGAGSIRRFFSITLPQLKSVSLVIVFMHIIWTAINYDFIWVLTQGGPYYSTETLPLLIYRYAMKKFDVGAASSLAGMMIMFMALLFIVYYYSRSKVSESLKG